MICPECGGETKEYIRWVDLGPRGTLGLTILVCPDCNWVMVHDWRLAKQYEMRFENKEDENEDDS